MIRLARQYRLELIPSSAQIAALVVLQRPGKQPRDFRVLFGSLGIPFRAIVHLLRSRASSHNLPRSASKTSAGSRGAVLQPLVDI